MHHRTRVGTLGGPAQSPPTPAPIAPVGRRPRRERCLPPPATRCVPRRVTLRELPTRRGLATPFTPRTTTPRRDRHGAGLRMTIATKGVEQNARSAAATPAGAPLFAVRPTPTGHDDAHVRAQQHFFDYVQLLGAHLACPRATARVRRRPETTPSEFERWSSRTGIGTASVTRTSGMGARGGATRAPAAVRAGADAPRWSSR